MAISILYDLEEGPQLGESMTFRPLGPMSANLGSIFCFQDHFLEELGPPWEHFGSSWSHFRPSHDHLGLFRGHLGSSWSCLRSSWAHFGSPPDYLGPISALFWDSWVSWDSLGCSWAVLGLSWGLGGLRCRLVIVVGYLGASLSACTCCRLF